MDDLRTVFRKLGRPPEPEAMARLAGHHGLLRAWNRRAHLVSGADAAAGGLVRHDLESLQALPFLAGCRRVADIGSGGGFPALVWACMRPELPVVLVESSPRKAAFLREACRVLDLPGVEVMSRRLTSQEDLVALGADLWTTRAAGCAPLLLGAARSAGDQAGAPADRRLVLYLGAAEAAALLESRSPACTVAADQPLASGAAGRLVILDC